MYIVPSTEIIRTTPTGMRKMATAGLDMRLDKEIKAKAEKASALLGLKSLTEYVVKLMDDNSTRVIAQIYSTVVKPNSTRSSEPRRQGI